jgi:mycothiol synthase
MDPQRYAIRPFVDSDYEAIARINSIVDPQHPETAASARRWHSMITADPRRIVLLTVVEEVSARTAIAWGGIAHTLENFHPDKYFVRSVVLPDHRHRGVGTELYRLLESEAIRRGAVCVWAGVRASDSASCRFLEHRGFVPLRYHWESRLDLTNLDLSRFPDRTASLQDQGIRITTLDAEGSDREDVRRRLYELDRATAEDEPQIGEYTPLSIEEFVAIHVVNPTVISDAIFVARRGQEYVGWTSLRRIHDRPDLLEIGFTGTLREFRGRGVASQLKRHAVESARDQGFQSVITGNDSLNPAIWAINEKLGFRKVDSWIRSEKSLAGVPTVGGSAVWPAT